MSVELKVELVGDDPQQQDALTRPEATPAGPSVKELLDGLQQPAQPTREESWLRAIANIIDDRISKLGMENTLVGRMVSRTADRAATFEETARSFVGGVTGRTAAAAGAEAEAGVATAAGAAAGPIVALTLAAGAAALSVKKFMDNLESVARELADLSPEIAVEQAQSDMRLELARLDRARRIGPEVASIDAAQRRITESMYEVQTRIYELLLKGAPVIELGVNSLNVIIQSLNVQVATMNSIAATLTVWDPTDDKKAQDELAKAIDSLGQATAEMLGQGPPDMHDQIDPFLAELLSIGNAPPAPRRPARKPVAP